MEATMMGNQMEKKMEKDMETRLAIPKPQRSGHSEPPKDSMRIKAGWWLRTFAGFRVLGSSRGITPTMKNFAGFIVFRLGSYGGIAPMMDNQTENEMESGMSSCKLPLTCGYRDLVCCRCAETSHSWVAALVPMGALLRLLVRTLNLETQSRPES